MSIHSSFVDGVQLACAVFAMNGAPLASNTRWRRLEWCATIKNVRCAHGKSDFATQFQRAVDLGLGTLSVGDDAALDISTLVFLKRESPQSSAPVVAVWVLPKLRGGDSAHLQALHRVCEPMPFMIGYVLNDGCFSYVNSLYARTAAHRATGLVGRSIFEFFIEENAKNDQALTTILNGFTGISGNYVRRRMDANTGSYHWFKVDIIPDLDAHDTVRGFLVTSVDIDREKRAELSSQERLRLLGGYIDNDLFAAIEYDDAMRIRWMSGQAEQLFGFQLEEAVGHTDMQLGIEVSQDTAALHARRLDLLARGDGASLRVRTQNRRISGENLWCDWFYVVVEDPDDNKRVVLALAVDVTENVTSRLRLSEAASVDTLTNLPNRFATTNALSGEAAAAWRAIFLIDLDGFKEINDSHGHATGDAFLKVVGDRLRDEIQPDEFVARLGGDEFLVCSESTVGYEGFKTRCEALLARICAPVMIEGGHQSVTASIGIYVRPEEDTLSWDSVRFADVAMYEAKKLGKNQSVVYSPSLSERRDRRTRIVRALRSAIANESIDTYFQPQISLKTGKLIGAEALARWYQADGTVIAPSEFVALATEENLIYGLGLLMLRAACRFVVAMESLTGSHFTVAVNISADQLAAPAFPDAVRTILAQTGCRGHQIELEITESTKLTEPESIAAFNRLVSELGIGGAIDDFGTGYSNLGELQALKIGTLKIDLRFVAGVEASNRTLVSALTNLGHTLGMRIVAEGVETVAQHDALREMGVDAFQGYLASPAIPAAQFPAFISRFNAALN